MYISQNLFSSTKYNQYSQPTKQQVYFGSNPNSHLLEFTPSDFFINIKGYGRDMNWGRKIRQLADNRTKKIKE